MYEYNNYASRFLIRLNKYVNRKYLNKDTAFTRKGKLSLEDTIYYPLLEEGHTNSSEANNYMQLITGDDFAMISQQAIGEKRGFIEPIVYEGMYKDYTDGLYKQFNKDFRYKDTLFLAGDTTIIKVPNVSKCKEEFLVEEDNPARARLSTFADAFSGHIYSAEIVEKAHSEVNLAINHLKDIYSRDINENICVMYDRGYDAYNLLFTHIYYVWVLY